MRKTPPKRRRYCDLLEVLRFLNLLRRKEKNVYQIYHSTLHFDPKKVYRYLRYCLKINLIELNHVDEDRFPPSKYYRLTEKGCTFIELFEDQEKRLLSN